uniref:Uncharacterized protein n=1 Tax=viral metagenome TaxID=1070528 RepID=A0A6M3X812_9ZZZZ
MDTSDTSGITQIKLLDYRILGYNCYCSRESTGVIEDTNQSRDIQRQAGLQGDVTGHSKGKGR